MSEDLIAAQSAAFEEKVCQAFHEGKTRAEAVRAVARLHPELHRAFLEHTNPRGSVRENIRRSFEDR